MNRVTEHYKRHGKVRYTIILSEDHQKRLAALAKLHEASQGDIIEAMLDVLEVSKSNESELKNALEKIRANKVDGRANRRALINKLAQLSPEQIAALETM